jgi:serine/threonine protein kinase
MGEVCRATDTRLKRQVAIKILPALLAADPDSLARFQREAEVLASLDHPNIAAIHGLEAFDGVKTIGRIRRVSQLTERPFSVPGEPLPLTTATQGCRICDLPRSFA